MAPFDFHEGEIAVQARVGVRAQAEDLKGMVQEWLKPGHADFFADRSEAFVASVDGAGRLWASAAFGLPGFAHALSPSAVVLEHGVHPWDPLWDNAAQEGSPLGFLFIELATRRRNRMNGVSVPGQAPLGGLHVAVRESFGNCPKYIQRRAATGAFPKMAPTNAALEELRRTRPEPSPRLTAAQAKLISQADFFTLATAASDDRGADMSHRGGRPGFVRVVSSQDLWFPDYRGNNLFQTLGNIMTNPQTGLLFIDWKSRTTLQLSGRARVVFPEELAAQGLADQFEAAKCAVHFQVEAVLETPQAVPYSYELLEYSPHSPSVKFSEKLLITPLPGAESMEGEGEGGLGREVEAYTGAVKVVAVRQVAKGIKDFHLRAPRAVRYTPGQYASFDLSIPAADGAPAQVVNRNWTISSAPSSPNGKEFHITVKHKLGGLASTWLHEQLQEGMPLHLTGIDGEFSCFSAASTPPKGKLLLLSAGVGITPMLSMLRGLRSVPAPPPAAPSKEPLDVVFFHSARSLSDIPFLEELSAVFAARSDVEVTFTTNLSQPTEDGALESLELPPTHRLLRGRLSQAMLLENVPALADRQVYLCGPQGYMNSAEGMLLSAGVPPAAIQTEAFYF